MRSRLGDPRALPIRNLVSNPRAVGTLNSHWGTNAGTAGTVTTSAGSDVGGTFARLTWTTPPSTLGGGLYVGPPSSGRLPIVGGRAHFASMKIRSSIDQVIRFAVEFRDTADNVLPAATIGIYNVKASIWKYIAGSFDAPAGATKATVTAYSHLGGTIWPAGATFDATNALVAETAGRPMFADGNSPGWRWQGAANASTSIGYPNLSTLDSIAGPPAAQVYGTGSVWNTIPGGPLDPITAYFCFHSTGLSAANYPSFAQFGGATTGTGRLTLQSGATGADDLRVRFDTGNGSTNIVVPIPGSRITPGTHVMVGRIPPGLGTAFASFDGGDEASKSIVAGDGIPRTMLNVSGSTTGEVTPLWTVAYNESHPASTRAQIVAWLMARA